MCQAASSSHTEHVQNRPPALHVHSEYARDVHGDELVQIPKGGECNFNHLFYFFLFCSVFLLCWELSPPTPSPPGCFRYCSHSLLFVVPAPLEHQQLHFQRAAVTPRDISAEWNPIHPLLVRRFNTTLNMKTIITLFTPPPAHCQVWFPECFVSNHMVQGMKFSSYF